MGGGEGAGLPIFVVGSVVFTAMTLIIVSTMIIVLFVIHGAGVSFSAKMPFVSQEMLFAACGIKT